jgi:hypothetical protein
MSYAAPLTRANPSKPPFEQNALVACIQACFDCAQSCTGDADADLGEQNLREMARCIWLCLDCADVCLATGRMLSRQSAFDAAVARVNLQACSRTCHVCGDECEEHARHGMVHCQTCLEACRRCEQACNVLLASLPEAL